MMKASEVMTRDVVTVKPSTPVKDIARLMSERHISGLPVVADDGHLIGVVSQSDLLHRAELGTDRRPKSWLRLFADPDTMAREYSKGHGLTAHDVMSRHVVSVQADDDLQRVADVLDTHRIKRVPVMGAGKLVGLITRGDLVRALSRLEFTKTARALDDGSIQKALIDKMRSESWLDSSYVSVTVRDGVVELWGLIKSADQRNGLKVLVEETEGVKQVEDHLKVGLARISGL
jgi:CBS domain-containing protein